VDLTRCLTTRLPAQVRGNGFFQGTLAQRNEFESVRVFDTTLRDGEQTPRTSFNYDDKRAIAAALDDANVDVIEAGFPANSPQEAEAVADIADATDATVCGLARVVESDVEAALETGVEMVHVFASTSDVQIEDSMHSTRAEVVERSVAAVEQAKAGDVEVMFSPMDATRTDPDYLAKIVEAVDDVDVDWINIPDTCGVATPRRFGELVEFVGEHTDARIDVHTHDDFGLASANALAGAEHGADQAQVSVNGIGERAGNAALEEFVMAAESLYGAETGVDTTAIAHESGIHAAGVIENSETFEPGVMTPEMVGAEREVVLGKHSGTHAVRQHLVDEGYDPTDSEVLEVTKKVKAHASDDEVVTKAVLRAFAGEVGVERQRGEVTA
jgi:2-isopropylmalate synthase